MTWLATKKAVAPCALVRRNFEKKNYSEGREFCAIFDVHKHFDSYRLSLIRLDIWRRYGQWWQWVYKSHEEILQRRRFTKETPAKSSLINQEMCSTKIPGCCRLISYNVWEIFYFNAYFLC